MSRSLIFNAFEVFRGVFFLFKFASPVYNSQGKKGGSIGMRRGDISLENLPENLSEQARKVLEEAEFAAQRLNHNYVGTEHILLGLLVDKDDPACQILNNLGVGLEKAESAVKFIIGRGERAYLGKIELTPRSKVVIDLAVEEARKSFHGEVGTVALLLGLVKEGEGIAAGVLESLGVDFRRLYGEVSRLDMVPPEDLERGAEAMRRLPGFSEPVKPVFDEDKAVLRARLIAAAIFAVILVIYLRRKRKTTD